MWYKLTLAVFLIVALVILSVQNREQVSLLNQYRTLTRQATNVVMYERKRDTGKSMVVSAKDLREIGERISYLKNFQILQQKGLKMSGEDAAYDRKLSVLNVKGPLQIETADGARAQLNGLTWDREHKMASTANPIRLVNKDGIIVADRAEFSDEFTHITLIGSVHAQIAQNMLNH
jgi:hypothetical protein